MISRRKFKININAGISRRRGQTIVELIVALFMLTVGLLGILSLLAQSLEISKNIANQTTATYLAAEGIEIAKNLIDHDVYTFLDDGELGWGSCFTVSGDYELDYTMTTCPPVHYSDSDFLYYNGSTNLYSYNKVGATATIFTRDVKVSENGNEITVQSIVRWPVGLSVYQTIQLEDHFYNWHP